MTLRAVPLRNASSTSRTLRVANVQVKSILNITGPILQHAYFDELPRSTPTQSITRQVGPPCRSQCREPNHVPDAKAGRRDGPPRSPRECRANPRYSREDRRQRDRTPRRLRLVISLAPGFGAGLGASGSWWGIIGRPASDVSRMCCESSPTSPDGGQITNPVHSPTRIDIRLLTGPPIGALAWHRGGKFQTSREQRTDDAARRCASLSRDQEGRRPDRESVNASSRASRGRDRA